MADGNGSGRRWYDSAKVIWGLFVFIGSLFSVVGLLLAVLVSMAWGVVESNGKRVNELEKIVPVVQAQNEDIKGRLGRIEDKLNDG